MNITKELEELNNKLNNKLDMENYKEKKSILNSATTTFSELVTSVALSKQTELVKIVERYDQELLTREELIKLIVKELSN